MQTAEPNSFRKVLKMNSFRNAVHPPNPSVNRTCCASRLPQTLGIGMTALAFEASKIATVDPDGHCHLVGFASDSADPQNHLMLQRSFSHDERDLTSGQDTYHFELSRHDHARYGGIATFHLSRNQAEVSFEPQTIKILGGIAHVVITFNVSDNEYAALSQGLQTIFAGTGRLVASNA